MDHRMDALRYALGAYQAQQRTMDEHGAARGMLGGFFRIARHADTNAIVMIDADGSVHELIEGEVVRCA